MSYKASQIKTEHKEYDPFITLNIDRGSTDKEIKKAYRELTKIMHPDRGGSDEEFKELTKAYKVLTDAETKENMEKYGNPDGPGVTEFGIALPKWIVDGKNSYIVLGMYVLVFMIVMPICVGMWWYKSIKYTGDQVLMKTTQLYIHCLMKTPQVILKRAIMILGTSFEFEKSSNSEIVERPSDNVEVPSLLRELPDVQEKIKEVPYSFPFGIKARTLIHAHLLRMDLPADTLAKDRDIVIKKSPFLINEMINIVSNLVATANSPGAPRGFHAPQLETLENIMKLSPMIVQALWDKNKKHTLLQLPHINEGHLRHFVTKKRNICDIKQFVQMKDVERRSILRHLTDEQYGDVMRVCATYPLITMNVNTKVFDDEDDDVITAGAIVTVGVSLRRQDFSVLFEKEEPDNGDMETKEEIESEDVTETLKAGSGKKVVANPKGFKAVVQSKKMVMTKTDVEDGSGNEGSDVSNEEEGNSSKTNKSDDFFEKFQQIQKKKESLVTKEKMSHRVYCPYFPEVKQEFWWLYVSERKKKQIISAPNQICSLKDTEEIDLKFMAPTVPGTYTYTVCLRSDSYLDFDIIHNFKLEVQPAKKIEEHPQWNFTDEEDAGQDEQEDSEFDTESEEE
jgi:translocation protein SEC63